jgi:hypothetical protein
MGFIKLILLSKTSSRKDHEIGWALCTYGGEENRRVMMSKTEAKRPFGRPGLRWGNNVEVELQEREEISWIGLICSGIAKRGRLL